MIVTIEETYIETLKIEIDDSLEKTIDTDFHMTSL